MIGKNLTGESRRFTGLIFFLLLIIVAAAGCVWKGNRTAGLQTNLAEPNPLLLQHKTSVRLQDAITAIRKMQAPQGVEEKLFNDLKVDLEKALIDRGVEKFSSKAPGADSNNSINLITDAAGLTWNEARWGDWNNDGAVSAQDLSPLAFNFGKNANLGDPEYYQYAAWIDGNKDGVVNAGDLTPIAFHFGESTGGYNIYEANDSSGNGKTRVADFTRPPVPADPSNPPTNTSFVTLTYGTAGGSVNPPGWIPTPGKWYQVIPFDTSSPPEESTGVSSAWVELPGATNQLPIAVLQANPTSGDAPLLVNFDGTGSSDPDGAVVRYQFDYTNDTNWDDDNTTGTSSYTYTNGGTFTAKLRVWDDKDAVAVAQVTITVTVPGNVPPAALADATPRFGVFPLDVTLDGSGSSDSDGQIVLYEWDFETDGNYDYSDPAIGITQHTYTNPGIYQATLRVTDDQGATATDVVTITVNDQGSGGLANTPWPKFNKDLPNRGSSIYSIVTSNPTQVWSTNLSPYTIDSLSPVIGPGGTIYIGSIDRNLYAVNPDGSQKWAFQAAGDVNSVAAIAGDGTIYFNTVPGLFYAINPDGSQKWTFVAGGTSSPTVEADGTVYVGGEDKQFYAINPDGSQKWAYDVTGYVLHSPAVASDGTIYVGGNYIGMAGGGVDRFVALNPDGTLKWDKTPVHPGGSAPAVGQDGTVYVISVMGTPPVSNLIALNPLNGSTKWTFSKQVTGFSAPSIGPDGKVYISAEGLTNGRLYAINPANGMEVWNYMLPTSTRATPVITGGGNVLIGCDDGRLYAVNSTGTKLWDFMAMGEVKASAIVDADGSIILCNATGRMFRIAGP